MPYADPEAKRRYDAERYARNRKAVKERVAARLKDKLEEVREYRKKYRTANKDRLSQHDAARYQANREKRDAATKKWSARNPAARSEQRRRSKKKHPDSQRDYKKRRKARIRGAARVERFKAEEIYERDHWMCGICHKPILSGDESLDHVVPVSKGGEHTRSNVRAAHFVCNRNRGNRA